MEQSKKRNSSVELLKIFAILIIIASHSLPCGVYSNRINPASTSTDIKRFLMTFIFYFGQIGNCIFVICSSYYLIDNKKANKKKILRLIIDSLLISVLILSTIMIIKYNLLGFSDIFKSFFPITFSNNWFLTCYLLFYAVHPLINKLIDNLTQKEHLFLCLSLLFIYSAYRFILKEILFYNYLIGFIIIFILISYCKKYLKNISSNKKVNIILSISSILFLLLGLITINFVGNRVSIASNALLGFDDLLNPFILCLSIGLFNLAKSKETYNKSINYLSSLTLYIYLFHANPIIGQKIEGLFFNFMINKYGFSYILLYVLILFFIYAIGSIILSMLYKLIFSNIVNKISDFCYKKIQIIYNFVENKILKLT